ncbi:MurT ligase domain-containing protein [Bifidobacterium sp. ESL0764]|uniref:MurT ligase domain-containing protein n=1 Tax=Bifidobacterium sp. ESL0764 TaxID=2983228 RepID=UPI0023F76AC8|nr:MurT ligase domain-containing protein [Bifidobacterium sp. ESL0764]WEV66546.1 MurT ligase domain-containing protein [Bifidobacterium sp. ESL0764]
MSNETSTPHKPWTAFATPTIGKAVRGLSRLLHHGGSALPGEVVEKIDPTFLARTLGQLPYGVVLVSGTNGKTTTTRMIASILKDLNLKVFTNPTGSNFTRGVVSALLTEVSAGGKLDADIAVLELDEAYAVHFVHQVKPRYSLLLNVMRDQLDRFGEIDNTARLLSHVAASTTGTVVLNREDRRIAALAHVVPQGTQVRYFGLSDELRKLFPSDDDMHAGDLSAAQKAAANVQGVNTALASAVATAGTHSENDVSKKSSGASGDSDSEVDFASQDGASASAATASGTRASQQAGGPNPHDTFDSSGNRIIPKLDARETVSASPALADSLASQRLADVVLSRVGDHEAEFVMDDAEFETTVQLEGVYNLFNAAAALAVVRAVTEQIKNADTTLPRARDERLMRALSRVTPAFGRGEVIEVDGAPVELLLVKNPMGFRMSLSSFAPVGHDTMIVINDEYADGRDMSWLWDVDFTSLRDTGVKMVSGVRAWDMALRLEYEGVTVGQTDTNVEEAVRKFVTTDPGTPKHIYCTYTAMLKVRSELGKYAEVADAGVGK